MIARELSGNEWRIVVEALAQYERRLCVDADALDAMTDPRDDSRDRLAFGRTSATLRRRSVDAGRLCGKIEALDVERDADAPAWTVVLDKGECTSTWKHDDEAGARRRARALCDLVGVRTYDDTGDHVITVDGSAHYEPR
jgi:hypothetical protein